MTSRKQPPLGRQVFSEIIEGDFLYADKTDLVYEMTHLPNKYVFLSRPRRFGKTLLVSTLEAYFQGRRRLFEGLRLERLEHEWETFPVVRLDLSSVKAENLADLESSLSYILSPLETRYGCDSHVTGWSARVGTLLTRVHEQTAKPVVVLVDEYDAPLLNVVDNPEMSARFRQVMREFYAPLKGLDAQLRFVFLTGITKFSQLSIFSELNNILNISMLPNFASVCGITEEELRHELKPGVEQLASALSLSLEETLRRLKHAYDGYHFCLPSPDIYNPYSVLSAFFERRFSSSWFASGTPASLIKVLRASDLSPLDFEGTLSATANSFDAPTEHQVFILPFMYQAGYLTIKSYDDLSGTYNLGIPNHEVEIGLYQALLPYYLDVPAVVRDSFLQAFLDALYREEDVNRALTLCRSLFAGIPYDLAPKDEKAFQTVLYLLFTVVGANVSSEVRTAAGRVDMLWETSRAVYVMELKYDRPAEEAVRQIDERGYLIPWQADDKPVVKVGVSWSSAERTIAEGWIVEETGFGEKG